MSQPNKPLNRILRAYTLRDAYKSLDQEATVIETFQLEKANGENAQVSYCVPLDAWVICSKNVSLLARNEADLPQFS